MLGTTSLSILAYVDLTDFTLEKAQKGFDFSSENYLSLRFHSGRSSRDVVTVSILAFLSRSHVLSFYQECTQIDFLAALHERTQSGLSRVSRINFLPHTTSAAKYQIVAIMN